MDIQNIIADAQLLLLRNPEWVKRYEQYANEILTNLVVIKKIRKKFNEFTPFRFYITTTEARRTGNSLSLDIRYRGQNIAKLNSNGDKVTISTKGLDAKNLRDFDCKIALNNVLWGDQQVTEFRKFFRDRVFARNNVATNKRNEEHSVESLLLTEFSKQSSIDKQIVGIKPIKLVGVRFGMPTPISASDHTNLKYAKQYGGGIDIFSFFLKGRATYLTVVEVKDENDSKEPPQDALKQAIQYSVFIRQLIRSKSGQDWYEIFGFSGKVPKNLTIRAVCAMPDDILDKSFKGKSFAIGDDKIECHYIYFKYDGQRLSNFQTSL